MTVQRGRCTRCGRTIYEWGRALIIEAARVPAEADAEEEPVETFFARLLGGRDLQLPADVAIVLEEYAREGTLDFPRELNDLRGELREIKVGKIRLTFYLVRDDLHPVPVIRLATGFIKKQWRTPRREIDRGLWVVGKDKQA